MESKTRTARKKRIISLNAAVAVVLGSIAYGLADRYLIDHVEALALSDGGGSSTMYFMGDVVNNPLSKIKERGVSDILYIKE